MCGGRNATCTPPPTPPPQDNNPQAVGAGLSAGRLRAAPLGCPPSAPAASQRAIKVDPEHSWGGGRGRRGGGPRLAAPQLRVFFSPPPSPPTPSHRPAYYYQRDAFIFKAARRVRSPARMLRRRPARPPPPRAAAPHVARPRSGAGNRRDPGDPKEKLHGSTRSDQLFGSLPLSLFLNNISLVGGLGFYYYYCYYYFKCDCCCCRCCCSS